jgi:hypothetical protein
LCLLQASQVGGGKVGWGGVKWVGWGKGGILSASCADSECKRDEQGEGLTMFVTSVFCVDCECKRADWG